MALGIEPEYTEAIYERGRALKNTGKQKDAIASFDQVLSLNPGGLHLQFMRKEGHFLPWAILRQPQLHSIAQSI